MARILGTADIGSNTVHLLVGETDGRSVRRILNESEWLSLGEVVSRCGAIPGDLEQKLVATLGHFAEQSRRVRAERLYVFATEAMRVAQNHAEVIARIRRETQIDVRIISPVQEARFSLIGTSLDTPREFPLLMVEVGGGSAQIARASDLEIHEEISLPLGTGRLTAQAEISYPMTGEMVARLSELVETELDRCWEMQQGKCIVGSGGIARGLIRGLHPDGDPVLFADELDYVLATCRRLTHQELAARFRVKHRRAGTFGPGALVYRRIMDRFQMDRIHVSEFGVREGALLSMAWGILKE